MREFGGSVPSDHGGIPTQSGAPDIVVSLPSYVPRKSRPTERPVTVEWPGDANDLVGPFDAAADDEPDIAKMSAADVLNPKAAPEVATFDETEQHVHWIVVLPRSPAAAELGNGAAKFRSSAPGEAMRPKLIDRVVDAVAGAVKSGESCEHLLAAVRASAVGDTTKLTAALAHVAEEPLGNLSALRNGLGCCEFGGQALITCELESLEARTTRNWAEPLAVTTDARGFAHLDWGDQPTHGADSGHLVLVGVDGAQAGEGNRQVNVFTHVIDDPQIDFHERLSSPKVQEALGALSEQPNDPELRQAALDALSARPGGTTDDWTREFAATGTATSGWCAERLNGTVAVVHSRAVQVGNHCYQENRILHTVSPTIDGGALLAGDAQLANSFLDMACSGDRSAAGRFEIAMSAVLTHELGGSRTLTSHGTVYRPPGAGRTLTITEAAGVTVGRRVSQKNHHLQEAEFGDGFARSTRRIAHDTHKIRAQPQH